MSARWVTFLVWALVAASAAAWGLKLFVTAPTAPPQVAVAGQSQLPRGDVTRVLGADAPPPVDPAAGETLASAPADARFQLVGVVAPRGNETARGGVALIAVDGKPPKAFPIGAVVDGDHIVQAIRARGADLGPVGGKVAVALNIPPPAAAATGTLPNAAPGGATPPAAARPPAGAAPAGATPGATPGAPAASPATQPRRANAGGPAAATPAPTPPPAGAVPPPSVPPPAAAPVTPALTPPMPQPPFGATAPPAGQAMPASPGQGQGALAR